MSKNRENINQRLIDRVPPHIVSLVYGVRHGTDSADELLTEIGTLVKAIDDKEAALQQLRDRLAKERN